MERGRLCRRIYARFRDLALIIPALTQGIPGSAEPLRMATKFRETMWFKMGEQQAEEAEAADAEQAPAALLPIEDRYTAEASAHDTKTFGLHTGMTDSIKAMRHVQIVESDDDVPMKSLVREMKRTKRAMLIGAGAAALCVAFAVYIF